jgi:hypothetical protein
VRPQKFHKIDLNSEYPCPCRRRGHLLPIALTEAFGCDRCQQIFVVDEKNQIIEQLSSNYPYKPAWRWTGCKWIAANYRLGESGLPLLMIVVLFVVIIGLCWALRPSIYPSMIWTALLVLLGMLVLLFWLANRH